VLSTDSQAGAQAPRVLIAQASTSVKALAIVVLGLEFAISIFAPTWVMGLIVGVQIMVVREAFRQIKIHCA
jgi:hypothetical protein